MTMLIMPSIPPFEHLLLLQKTLIYLLCSTPAPLEWRLAIGNRKHRIVQPFLPIRQTSSFNLNLSLEKFYKLKLKLWLLPALGEMI